MTEILTHRVTPKMSAAVRRSHAALLAQIHAQGSLRYGSQGAGVRALQQQLAALHLYHGSVNGKFGTHTQNALLAFQRTYGAPMAAGLPLAQDGVANAVDAQRLNSRDKFVMGSPGTELEFAL